MGTRRYSRQGKSDDCCTWSGDPHTVHGSESIRGCFQINTRPVRYKGNNQVYVAEAMRGIVPDSVLYNRKLGFPVPIRHWLQNELYEWAKNLIEESPTDHLFNKEYVLELLEAHRFGKIDYSRKIWAVLVFIIWHQQYMEQENLGEEILSETLV